MELIYLLLIFYFCFLIVELLNKAGHLPKNIQMIRWLPLPEARAVSARSRWGGIIVWALIFSLVAYFEPNIIYLQIMGLIAWVLFIYHLIIGSLNFEIKVPQKLVGKVTTEEIPNELWWLFIPLAIIAFVLFCCYYFDIINLLFSTNIQINIPNLLK